jgi:DNA-binding PadR family transcriptional regulator
MKLTTLDALLLFLVSHESQSGYDIRRLMQETPLGMFSDSPGAIYPALARLELRGLLASAAETDGRRRRAYQRTEAGAAALEAWLGRAPSQDALIRRPGDLDLQYVMLALVRGQAAATAFARRLAEVERARLAAVAAYLEGPGQALPRASRDTVELGLRMLRARVAWRREMMAREGDDDESHAQRGA